MTEVPAVPPTDDLIDRIAKEVAAEVVDHIEAMYPSAAQAVAWKSASRSIQGVVRNRIASASRATESGTIEAWLGESRRLRNRQRRIREALE